MCRSPRCFPVEGSLATDKSRGTGSISSAVAPVTRANLSSCGTRIRPLERIAPTGFEPVSQAPKARMLGHYTTGLRRFRRREWSWTYRLLPPGRYPPLGSRWEELLLPSP